MKNSSQKRKTVEELISGDLETSIVGTIRTENLVAGPSKCPRLQPKNIDEMKTSLRKEIMSDHSKLLAENQREMLKLIPRSVQNHPIHKLSETYILKPRMSL